MGCSLVAGIGLDDADTLDRVLAQIIGKPCVNLGVPAGGLQVLHYNTLRMIDAGIRPLSVSLLSPQWTRTVYFDNPSVNMGSWMLTEMGADYDPNLREYYYQHARTSPNAELHGYMHLRAIEAEWRNVGVPIHIWSLDDLGVDWHNFPDLARDRAHPGIETVKLWAERMAQAITPKP